MLELILFPNWGIQASHIISLFSNIASTAVGNGIAFDFLINRWDQIETAYAFKYNIFLKFKIMVDIFFRLGPSYLNSFYYSLRNRLNTQDDLEKVFRIRILIVFKFGFL